MLSASSNATPLFALTRRTVTNKHVYWKQAIETGAMYLDFFSAPTNKKKVQNPEHSTTTTTTTTEEGFYSDALWSLWTF